MRTSDTSQSEVSELKAPVLTANAVPPLPPDAVLLGDPFTQTVVPVALLRPAITIQLKDAADDVCEVIHVLKYATFSLPDHQPRNQFTVVPWKMRVWLAPPGV